MPDFPISGLKAKLTNSKIWSQSRLVARHTFILEIGSPKGIFSGSLGLRGFEARSYGREAQNTLRESWGLRFRYSGRVSWVEKAELLWLFSEFNFSEAMTISDQKSDWRIPMRSLSPTKIVWIIYRFYSALQISWQRNSCKITYGSIKCW